MIEEERQKHRTALNVFMEELDNYKYGSDEYNECVALIRKHLEALVGKTWTTSELQDEFKIDSFGYSLAFGTRKSDGQNVSIDFLHRPRFYHSVREA